MPIKLSFLKNMTAQLGDGKSVKWAVILGAVGVILLSFSSLRPKTEQTVKTVEDTAKLYCEQTEQKLSALLQNMEGVGNCKVYVTLENGVEYVYATEEKNNADLAQDGDKTTEKNDTQTSVILVDGDTGETGLLLTEIQPQIKGVVVVCDGGDTEGVVQRVTAVVTTALNISTRRVCVTK